MKKLKQNVTIKSQRPRREQNESGLKLRTGIKAGAFDTAPYGDKPYGW